MQTYSNTAGVSLPLALYLATDHYDHLPNTISATGLMKAVRPSVLATRVPAELSVTDVMDLIKPRIGTSIHDGLEKAWTNPETRKRALEALGYPTSVQDRIMVNPEKLLRQFNYPEESFTNLYTEKGPVNKDTIPIYMEIRNFKNINGKTVSGKFDFIAEGAVRDLKTTGTYTWVKNSKEDDYQIQGSIYRWLNPHLITEDVMTVDFVFTDWSAYKTSTQYYPPHPVMTKKIKLLSLADTEAYVVKKLAEFSKYKLADEQDIPLCTDKELWRRDPVFKYYKDPTKTARSTKNFNNSAEAFDYMQSKGKGLGAVVEKPGEVVACKYCAAFPVCAQKDALMADGSLNI